MAGGSGSRYPDADRHAFGRFVFGGVGLVGRRVQEETSVPHLRPGCVHLQSSFQVLHSQNEIRVTVDPGEINLIACKKIAVTTGAVLRSDPDADAHSTLQRQIPSTVQRQIPSTVQRQAPSTWQRQIPSTVQRQIPSTL